MKREPFTVIDIGSNSIRSMIVEPTSETAYRVVDDERETIRLASGMTSTGRLSTYVMKQALSALSRMAQIARSRGVKSFKVIATSAVRQAKNRRNFIDKIRNETGLRVRVLSGEEEGRLAFESAANSFNLAGKHSAVVDVGGGSVEIILAVGNGITQIVSLPMGAVAATERFVHSDPPKWREIRKLQKSLRKDLKARGLKLGSPPQIMIASGGTATALGQLAMQRGGLSDHPVQGFEMTQADVVHVLSSLTRRSLSARREMQGLSEDRADIIVAGVSTILGIMMFLKINTLKIGGRGIRHALIHRILKGSLLSQRLKPLGEQRKASTEEFGKSLKIERSHAEHVRTISLSLFDQLAPLHGLDSDSRELLASAAYLHDIGYVVNYRQHHKHSHHLITHAQLDGFSPAEKEMIAQVARYHRGTLPKKRHTSFMSLSKPDRKVVKMLAAILRVADAVDRRHTQRVETVQVQRLGDRVNFILSGRRPLEVEKHGVDTKSELFEKVFNCSLSARVAETPALKLVAKPTRQARG